MPPLLAELSRFALLCAGLLLPGAVWCRALPVPRTLATSFAGSVLALYLSVLALALLSIRIGVGSLAIALLVITVGGAAIVAMRDRNRASPVSHASTSPMALFRGLGWWSVAYGAFWMIALWRAVHEPLNGPDIEFRWGLLPEQMLRTGGLDFYPPRSGEDFTTYFWAESIPPGVAALHGWAFACAGRFAPAWTVPGVVLQLWAVHELMWHTADMSAGRPAARNAVLALAATPLLTWATLMGQETGLLALATMGLIYALVGWRRERQTGWATLAGSFAVIGAASREYGIAWLGFGALGLLLGHASRRAWVIYGAFAVIGLVWPFRTFLLTGNPWYSLPLAGWPANARFAEWVRLGAASRASLLHGWEGWSAAARYLLWYAPLALVGWAALAWNVAKRSSAVAIGSLAVTGGILVLWFRSVAYTDGGLFYSMRATAPAMVPAALAAGFALAAVTKRRWLGSSIAGLAFAASIPAMLALPANPWKTAGRHWPAFVQPAPLRQGDDDETVALVRRTPGARVVVTDGAGFGRRFAPTGLQAIPMWSPQADWLFDPALEPRDAAARQRETGVTHLLVRKLELNLRYLNERLRRPDGHLPFRLVPAGETPQWALFAIEPAAGS